MKSTKYTERMTHIEQLLLIEKKIVDTNKLREECIYGIPDELRPLCWRLFLDYLPKERHIWKDILKKQRNDYKELVDNLIVKPGELEDEKIKESNIVDHPLASESTSEWNNFFKDNEILIQIDRDVRRLRPEIQFFQKKTKYPLKSAARINLAKRLCKDRLQADEVIKERSFLSSTTSSRNASTSSLLEEDDESEYHWQVVERLLFIYSKVNPGIKYVQGMNELIGPIYFVFATDPDNEWAEHAESDTFYCFQHLMSEIKDNFIKTLDQSNCGIDMVMSKFNERLKMRDIILYQKLVEEQNIKPQFYAFRWILLLLSQEFSLPDLITLWDAVFASTNRLDYVQDVCLVMLDTVRDELLSGDFSTNVRLLQNFPDMDVSNLMIKAYDIKNNDNLLTSRSYSSSDMSESSLNNITKSAASKLFNSDKITALFNGAKAKLSYFKKEDVPS